MNWFKQAKDFSDRNVLNSKIRYLSDIQGVLKHLSDLIFQSGKNAKAANYKIISSSKITSYPYLRDLLIEADNLALDSPWKFSALCQEGIKEIDDLLDKFKKERSDLTFGKKKEPMKGWVDA